MPRAVSLLNVTPAARTARTKYCVFIVTEVVTALDNLNPRRRSLKSPRTARESPRSTHLVPPSPSRGR